MNISSSVNKPAFNQLAVLFKRATFFTLFSLFTLSSETSAQQNTVEEDAGKEVVASGDENDNLQQPQDITENTAPHSLSAKQWLARLTESTRSLNYQVSFILSRAGSETVPYLWRHGVLEDGTTVEQLNLQNGPGRELIRVGNVVSVFEPDVQPYSLYSESINGPIPSQLLYNPRALNKSYKFIKVGRARVSGRPAQQIRIVSLDNSRFSYQLWLDEASGMLLKFNMLDLNGNLLEQIQVTSLNIQKTPHPYFARVNQATLPQPMVITPSQPRKHNWEVDYLPRGMKEVKRDIRRLALTGQIVEYKMFSDGLVDVSVYVQMAEDAIGADMVLRHEVNTFLTLTDGQAQVTVVGEIPLHTANAIATSLSMHQPDSKG
ncbi:MucB/RseB C-terminal domain-containing protein [Alteromonas ponticola]|uniref:MucB/RseB C-terminal domain-containing protein n=1 Tax=Alteromonas aquimaris TaxID=2998417 RepID=A0ABT3P5M6_9ALTE|nr:MucB/RseB C-terminal domain-containing protein [Alteromonas aquimaris]MCW8107386.1 MucB/RseB C-terminal domain-containing protein [Alteromonas aquimaris]